MRLNRYWKIVQSVRVGVGVATLGVAVAGGVLPSPLRAQEAPAPVLPVEEREGPSPRGALFRSLVLPGWGQVYVGAPIRGAAYFAAESGALFMAWRANRELRAARDQDRLLRETGALPPNAWSPRTEQWEDRVEDWATFAVFLLFFSGADAYVAAHLIGFDENIGVRAAPGGGAQLEYRLPVGGRR